MPYIYSYFHCILKDRLYIMLLISIISCFFQWHTFDFILNDNCFRVFNIITPHCATVCSRRVPAIAEPFQALWLLGPWPQGPPSAFWKFHCPRGLRMFISHSEPFSGTRPRTRSKVYRSLSSYCACALLALSDTAASSVTFKYCVQVYNTGVHKNKTLPLAH